MPDWPKSFLTFRASLLTARVASRLRRRSHAPAEQAGAFKTLVEKLGATAFWRAAGIECGMTYEAFRKRVAPRGHDQLAPAIERMKRGEADVLWPGRCAFFARTSGTTGNGQRLVPVSGEMLRHFRRAGQEALLYYTARTGHAGVFQGRHLFLSGSTTLAPLAEAQPHEAYAGNLSGIAALDLPRWAEKHLYEPGGQIAQMNDWNAKLEAIAARARHLDISLLAGMPTTTLELMTQLHRAGAAGLDSGRTAGGLWPNLECFVHGGVPISPYQTQLRALLGPEVNFHEVYPAAEGFIAAQDGNAGAGLRVITRHGVFFEFIPLADYDETRLEYLGAKAVPLADVKRDVDYAVLLTTPAGLARHALGDVVRFVSVTPPRLLHVGRTRLQLNTFGERVSEKDLTEALVTVCQRNAWTIVNFHVAPRFLKTLTGQNHGQYEWWIELKPGTVATPVGPAIAAALDVEMQRLSPAYAAKRRLSIEPPTVRLVMPGLFEHWMRFHDKWGGEHKMPRCRGDRLVADELAQIAQFAED